MIKAAVYLVENFEPIEAIGVIDILRRGGVKVTVVSLTRDLTVFGAHDITIHADQLFDPKEKFDILILPGGPGTNNYLKCYSFLDYLNECCNKGVKIAAICAAPTVLNKLNLIDDKDFTCYPTYKEEFNGNYIDEDVVVDGNLITSKGPNTTISFALTILGILTDEKTKIKVSDEILK